MKQPKLLALNIFYVEFEAVAWNNGIRVVVLMIVILLSACQQ